MNKVVKILETNVEWIALGVAGIWVAWIVWAYVLTPPTIPVDNQEMTASTIDQEISDTTRAKLDRLINSPKVPDDIKLPPFDWNLSMTPPKPLLAVAVGSDPPLEQLKNIEPKGLAVAKIDKLPIAPPPHDLRTIKGRSQVLPPPPQVPPVALNGNNGGFGPNDNIPGPDGMSNPAIGNQPNPALAGLGGVAPAGIGAQPVTQQLVDKNWVSVIGLFNINEMDKAIKDSGIPPMLATNLRYARVQLERREVLGDGKYGDPELVPELPMNASPFDPKTQTPDYMTWLDQPQNQINALQPAFYQIATGDSWVIPIPGQENNPNNPLNPMAPGGLRNFLVDGKFDAQGALSYMKQLPTAKEQNDFRNSLTPQQRQLLYKAEHSEPDPNNPNINPGGRPVPQPIRDPRGLRGRDAYDPALAGEMLAQARPGYDPRVGMRARPGYTRPGYTPPYQVPGQAMPVPVQQFQRGGAIQPDANGDIQIWQHDETALPGRSYQYRMRVLVLNPVYGIPQAAPDIRTELLVPGKWSDWAKEAVTIPSSLKWYVVSANAGNGSVTVRIIKWQNGQPNTSPALTLTPGDAVGTTAPATAPAVPPIGVVPNVPAGPQMVDYDTGWAVADIRQVGLPPDRGIDTRVTLVDKDGNVMVRWPKHDQVEFNREQQIINPQPLPGAAAAR